ncbi:MAG: GFA family protein [Methylobacterium mesophilicum]|nr:GFA family protein [Methylobacterium mesophilicum]
MRVQGSCHCKARRFEAAFAPDTVTSCNCSFCAKSGALWAYYDVADVTLVSREREVAYCWNSKVVAHHFCGVCGCRTFSEAPDFSSGEPDFSKPKISLNARLFDDFDLKAVPIKEIDGRNGW